MLTPEQLCAARAQIDWLRDDLAKRSGVSPKTVWGFEQVHSDPKL
jgi:DNA-binding XRE family transcriptional regulator